MLTPKRYNVGSWTPDQPSHAASREVRNCVPYEQSYGPLGAFASVTDNASEPIVGAAYFRDDTGGVKIVVGTATRLLRLSGASWVVMASGFTGVTSWEFAVFGTRLIAVASNVDPQVADMSLSTPTFSAISGSPENPPRANRITVIRDIVMLGDVSTNRRLIQWSGLNNFTIWDTYGDVPSQAGAQELATGGIVQKLIGGPQGYVFQETEIKSLRYIGAPYTFSIQRLDRERGTPAPDSVVSAGDRVFFYAQDGFFMLQGSNFTPIGQERVNRWFRTEVGAGEIENMVASVDVPNRLAVWAFSSTGGSGVRDRLLLYNYAVDRWAYARVSIDRLFALQTVGYTLDTLATLLSSGIDIDSFDLESPVYKGGNFSIFASDSSGALGMFGGDALTAVVDTVEYEAPGNLRMRVNNVRPHVEGNDNTVVTVQMGTRDKLTAVPTYSAAQQLNAIDEAPVNIDARYCTIRMNVAGGFDHIVGATALQNTSGRF